MKIFSFLPLFLFLGFFGWNARAETVAARIDILTCSGWSLQQGTTTVVYSGNLAGQHYVNITNINPMGLPFTQQALINNVKTTMHNSLRFTLSPVVLGGTLYLELYNNSTRGVLSASPGEAGSPIELSCTSKITQA